MEVISHEDHSRDLLMYFYKQYQEKSFCDVMLITQDASVFNTHRIVLTASSRYLHQIFTNSPNLVTIKLDMTSEVLQILLDFAYTGQLFITPRLYKNIIEAATFLQMYCLLELMNKQLDKQYGEGDTSIRDLTYSGPSEQTAMSAEDTIRGLAVSTTQYIQQSMVVNDDTHSGEYDGLLNNICTEKDIPLPMTTRKMSRKQTSVTQTFQSNRPKTVKADDGTHIIEVNNVKLECDDSDLSQLHLILKQSMEQVDTVIQSMEQVETVLGENFTEQTHTPHSNEDVNKANVTSYLSKTAKVKTRSKRKAFQNVTNCNRKSNQRKGVDKKVKMSKVSKSRKTKTKAKTSESILQKVKNITKAANKVGRSRLKNNKEEIIKRKYVKKKKSETFKEEKNKQKSVLIPCKTIVKCLHCNKSFHSNVALRRHNILNHRGIFFKELVSKYLCKKYLYFHYHKHNIIRNGSNFQCNLCSKRYSRYSLVQLHLMKSHLDQSKARISSWQFTCFKLNQMQEVLKQKTVEKKVRKMGKFKTASSNLNQKQRTYECPKCDKKMISAQTLKMHLLHIHCIGSDTKRRVQGLYECPNCPKSTITQNSLFKHLQAVHHLSHDEAGTRQYDLRVETCCEVKACQFTSNNITELQLHMVTLHPYIRHPCPYCSATFQMELLLKRHVHEGHASRGTRYKHHCHLCDKTFSKSGHLQRHEFWKHDIKHDGIKIYRCEHQGCMYKTSQNSSLKSHQSRHSTEKLYKCEYCHLHLKTKVSHKKHVSKMHLGIRPYLCQVCGQSFGEDHELKSHFLYKHSTDRQYQCQHCPYATSVKQTFHTHLFNVHKERSNDDKREIYQCPYCPFKAILHTRYKNHLNSHTDTRDYHCAVCGKAFVSSATLRAHKQWMHSEKNYTCTQCNYATKTSQKLNEHISVQHQLKGLKPYKCPYCDFHCATGGNTRKHVKQVHKGQVVTYLRDENMITAARLARGAGHHASLVGVLNEDKSPILSGNKDLVFINVKPLKLSPEQLNKASGVNKMDIQ